LSLLSYPILLCTGELIITTIRVMNTANKIVASCVFVCTLAGWTKSECAS
jgi:hypothetical protein